MSVKPYTFANTADALQSLSRFDQERLLGDVAKPSGFNVDTETRLSFLLYRQKTEVMQELKRRFPKTADQMVPVTLPVMRFFVKELAKVFLNGCDMPLAGEDGESLPGDADEAKAWAKLQEDVGLALKLKRLDRYTTGLGVSFLKWGHGPDGVTAHIVLPQLVEAVLDPAYPMDLDKAHLVRVELGSNIGGPDGKTVIKRFEVWCARAGEEVHAVVRADGTVETLDETYPYVDEDGKAAVPLVAFAQHTEELGLFPRMGQGLHEFNLAVDVAITGLYEIAETQGWGELILTVPEGASPPPVIERGPRRAVALKDGIQANVLNYNAPIQDLVAKLQTDLKLAAMLHNLSPGSVSLEARAVASGVALQVEMRPLMEERQDAVEAYAPAMRRLWRLARLAWNAWTQSSKAAPFKPGTTANWQPGDIQMPESEGDLLDRLLSMRRAGWMSDKRAVARLFKVSEEQAERLLEEAKAGTAEAEPQDPMKDPGEKPDPAAAPARDAAGEQPVTPPGSKAADVQAQAVDPTTALNGAQVAALVDVITQVAEGKLPRATGVEVIVASFPVSRQDAERIMGKVGQGFKPEEPPAPAPFQQG